MHVNITHTEHCFL